MSKLCELNCQQKGQISHIAKHLTEDFLSYGIFPGIRIKVIHKLPFKGPVVIEIRDSTLSLRYNDAKNITLSDISND